MHLNDVEAHLQRRAQERGLQYALGPPASSNMFVEAEQRLGVTFPAQVRRFYEHYDGLRVEDPFLEILPLAHLRFLASNCLYFATVDDQRKLCFDTAHLNPASQWNIVAVADGYWVTLTMASFWSNKIWRWLDRRRPIWRPERDAEHALLERVVAARQPERDAEHALLERVVAARQPGLLPLLNLLGKTTLTDDQREELRGVMADELVEAGLDHRDEPTKYGLALDDVISWLGPQ